MNGQRVGEKENQSSLNERGQMGKGGGSIWQQAKRIIWIVVVAAALGNYFIKMLIGIDKLEDFVFCSLVLMFLVVPALFAGLVRLLRRLIYRKDLALNPATMVLPERGTVTLEDALHKMSTQVGVIVWDVLISCVMFALLGVFWIGEMTLPSLLQGLVTSTAFMAMGHGLFHLFWKKRTFSKRMIRNSAKYFPVEVHGGYADSVSASLSHGVLSYEKQLILTNDYILCTVGEGNKFIPVAVPRAKVTEYVFYFKTISGYSYSKTFGLISYKNTFGVLSCKANVETLVNLLLGTPYAAQKVLRILDYYQIPWTDRDARRR